MQERSRDPQAHWLWSYRCQTRRGDGLFSSAAPEPLRQLLPSLRGAQSGYPAQWEASAVVRALGHAVGDVAGIAARGELLATRGSVWPNWSAWQPPKPTP